MLWFMVNGNVDDVDGESWCSCIWMVEKIVKIFLCWFWWCVVFIGLFYMGGVGIVLESVSRWIGVEVLVG